MASLNKVMVIGNLGRDPEVYYSDSGRAMAKLSVATSEVWNDKTTGERRERTEWHKVLVYGKHGEICGRYLTKGRQVYVEGRLQTSSYEKDGITRYGKDIIASKVTFLGRRDPSAGDSLQGTPDQHNAFGMGQSYGVNQHSEDVGEAYQQPPGNHEKMPDDDIPF